LMNGSTIRTLPAPKSPPSASIGYPPELLVLRDAHNHPLYEVSFDPNECYGRAPFGPDPLLTLALVQAGNADAFNWSMQHYLD
jgi:hypothetical protein